MPKVKRVVLDIVDTVLVSDFSRRNGALGRSVCLAAILDVIYIS